MRDDLAITFRALSAWPGARTPSASRVRAQFKASWQQTMNLLTRELSALAASHVVLSLDCDESQTRRDGLPRSDARVNGSGVVLSFEHPRVGALMYPCDRYTHWQHNVRAIALALEALRAVDRYGVTRRSEQYRGWKALPESTTPTMSVESAAHRLACTLAKAPSEVPTLVKRYLRHREDARDALRRARFLTHPDRGGARAEWDVIEQARLALERHHGGAL